MVRIGLCGWVEVYGVYMHVFYSTSTKINIRMSKPYQRMYYIPPLTDMCVTVYFNSIGEWVLDLPIEMETTTLNSELKLGTWWRVCYVHVIATQYTTYSPVCYITPSRVLRLLTTRYYNTVYNLYICVIHKHYHV